MINKEIKENNDTQWLAPFMLPMMCWCMDWENMSTEARTEVMNSFLRIHEASNPNETFLRLKENGVPDDTKEIYYNIEDRHGEQYGKLQFKDSGRSIYFCPLGGEAISCGTLDDKDFAENIYEVLRSNIGDKYDKSFSYEIMLFDMVEVSAKIREMER